MCVYIVWVFKGVDEIRGIVRYEFVEKCIEVMMYVWIGIFVDSDVC